MSLRAITRFVVPVEIVQHTDQALSEAGEEHMERFVLWSGVEAGDEFLVQSSHVPAQTAYQSERGLMVVVEGPALHQLNVWLHEHRELLGVQVHAHPEEAYHSETDNSYPIVTESGALSIVVPDFARRGLRSRGTAVYRLLGGRWQLIRRTQRMRLLEYR